jgi:hypothetical protein
MRLCLPQYCDAPKVKSIIVGKNRFVLPGPRAGDSKIEMGSGSAHGGHSMRHCDVQQQILIEQEILAHVVSALRTTMGWHTQGSDVSRKLSSLRFVNDSFRRHLKRLLQLEQSEGYLVVVLESRPELSEEVRALREQHVQFRKTVRDIAARLKRVAPNEVPEFNKICDDLTALVNELEAHHLKEADLLQEALLRDEGGEG